MTTSYQTNSRYFAYRDGLLYAENVNLMEIAQEYGTPAYVYSSAAVLDVFQGYQKGLEGIPHLIAYAVKANGSLALMHLLAKQGGGADLTSVGEMHLGLKAGIPAERMVFSGVGKADFEIRGALEAGILMFNVESESELIAINRIAKTMHKTAPIAIRVNPDIDAQTHPKITTGLKENKFGLLWEQALPLYLSAAKMENIEILGISAHIGSSLQKTSPLLDTLDRLLALHKELREKGITAKYIDIGGGLGIKYKDEDPESSTEYARKLKDRFASSHATLILEPGRSLVGNAGVLLTRVTYIKRTPVKTFYVVDAGMNDLARPAIYGAHHSIVPVQCSDEAHAVDVVGPICESSDVFGKERQLPACKEGDFLAICSAGAYGFSMSSHYNGRVRPCEILVNGNEYKLVRKRESLDELWRNQII